MIKIAGKTIYLIGNDGRKRIFHAGELENELRGCFAASGDTVNMFLAGDIALAMEYELCNSRDGKTELDEKEFDELLYRLLNNLNLPEISQAYREKRKSANDTVLAEGAWVDKLAMRVLSHLSEQERSEVCVLVREALVKLGLTQVTGNLLVEMLHSYALECRRRAGAIVTAGEEKTPSRWKGIESGEIFEACPEEVQHLYAAGVILCDDVKSLLPSLKIQIFLKNYASLLKLNKPTTELEFFTQAATLGSALVAIIDSAKKIHGRTDKLPVYVYFPDLDEFLSDYFEIAEPSHNPLRSELVEEICRASDVAIK